MKVDRVIDRDRPRSVRGYALAAGVLLGAAVFSDRALSATPSGEVARPETQSGSLADKGPRGPEPSSGAQAASPPRSKVSLFLIRADIDVNKLDLEAIKAGRQPPPLAPPLLLSADIPGAPLRKVLLDLGRKLEAKVYVPEGIGDEVIKVAFKELPVDEAIKRIVQPRGYLLVRAKVPVPEGMKDTGETRIAEIRVLGQAVAGQGAGAAPPAALQELKVDPVEHKSELEELARLVREGETPKDRRKALSIYLDRADAAADPDVVMQAAKDADPRVQKFALGHMSDLHEAPPMEPIANIALEGNNAGVRLAAIDALLSTHGAQASQVLEQIKSGDASEAMRSAAENGLRRIERVQAVVRKMEERRAARAAEKAAANKR